MSFTLDFDPALLSVTGAALAANLPPGTTLTRTIGASHAQFAVLAPTPIAAGSVELIRLSADVPAGAPYGAKQVLDIGSVVVDDAIDGRGDDGLHVAAYFGDTSGNAAYTTLDVQRLQRVILRYDSGFAEFPNVDPIVLGDINGSGTFTAVDIARLLQEVNYVFSGTNTDRPEIPDLPVNVAPVPFSGPDPSVAIPASIPGRAGDTVTVPINLDTAADLESVQLSVSFDATKLELVNARRGVLTADFAYYIERRAPGELRIDMSRLTKLDAGAGSILELDLKIKDSVLGSVVVDLVGTVLNDGHLTLNVLPVPGADASDGSILVAPAEVTAPASKLAKLLGRLREKVVGTLSARVVDAAIEGNVSSVWTAYMNTADREVKTLDVPTIRLDRDGDASLATTVPRARSLAVSVGAGGDWRRSFVASTPENINPNATLKVTIDMVAGDGAAPPRMSPSRS